MPQPTLILFFPVFDYGYKGSEYIPFSILQLERAVRHLDINIILIDENVTPDFEEIIKTHKDSLFLAGISAITGFQIKGGIEFSQCVKKHAPKAKIVWGGWHTTIVPEQTLAEPYIDYIIRSQGEKPFKELAEALLNNTDIENISSLGYKRNKKVVLNPLSDFCNTNEFPDVNYKLIELDKYVMKTDFSERRLMYFASYGCPYNCPFCSGSQIFQKRWYHKSIETIITDLKYFKSTSNIDSIMFWDDNFFSNKAFVLSLAQRFIDENLNLLWAGSAHAGGFLKMCDDNDLKLLFESGLRRVDTGAESGSNKALEIIKDKLSKEDTLQLISRLKKHHIKVFFSTMIAYPIQGNDDIKQTFNLIRKAKLIDNDVKVQINIYTPYPQTALYKMATDAGFNEPQQLSEWIMHAPAKFQPPWLPKTFQKKFENLFYFYLPFSEKKLYKRAPKHFRKMAKILFKLFHPLVLLRFHLNVFEMPFESHIYNYFLKKYNKKHNDNFRFYAYGVFGG